MDLNIDDLLQDAKPFNDRERTPANWSFKADGDVITATNGETGRKFKGTMAEFNKKLSHAA